MAVKTLVVCLDPTLPLTQGGSVVVMNDCSTMRWEEIEIESNTITIAEFELLAAPSMVFLAICFMFTMLRKKLLH